MTLRNPLLSVQHPQPPAVHPDECEVQASFQECCALQEQQVRLSHQQGSTFFTILTSLENAHFQLKFLIFPLILHLILVSHLIDFSPLILTPDLRNPPPTSP